MSIKIHPTALIDSSAKIEEGVTIGPFTIVENGVRIGKNTKIASHVKVASDTQIGDECQIFHGAVIGEIPQDLKFHGEKSKTIIGDRNIIREFVTIHRGTEDRKETRIGSDNLLMAYVHVAHDCIVGDHTILANTVQLGGHVIVDEWAIVGGMVGVHQFTRIGKHSFIGGGFRCVQNVPPYILASGEPLKYVGLNLVGLRRRGFTNATIQQLKDAYRLIYRSGINIGQAIEQIQSGFELTTEIQEIINFIQHSERGIV